MKLPLGSDIGLLPQLAGWRQTHPAPFEERDEGDDDAAAQTCVGQIISGMPVHLDRDRYQTALAFDGTSRCAPWIAYHRQYLRKNSNTIMSTWRVQPFARGAQETKGTFAHFQEAIVFASRKARETRIRWAIFGDDHELDTVIAPEDKMPWENIQRRIGGSLLKKV